jgi:hypothetical protein
MTIPLIQSIQPTSVATSATTQTVNLPASLVVGELLVLILGFYGSNPTFVTPTGWTLKYKAQEQGGHVVFVRVVTGSEGATLVVDCTVAQNITAQVYRITTWDGSLAGVESVTPNTLASSASVGQLDAPAITASWGATDNLVITIGSLTRTGAQLSTVPAGYAFTQSVSGLSAANYGVGLSTGSKGLTATAADDPGVFAGGTFKSHHTGTIIIRGQNLSASITLTQTEITPNGTISGSYSNWGGTAPTKLEGIRGANSIGSDTGEITGFTVTGDGTSGTFTATIADLPATGSAQYLRLQAAGIVDVTWRLT